MSLDKWLKRKMAMVSLAMAGVEKNALSQKGGALEDNITQVRRHSEGTLLDALKQGKITQEVINLRWRTYKILDESEGLTTKIIGYDDHNLPVTETIKSDKKKALSNVKLDAFDSYPLEMVVDNTPITISGNDAMDNALINIYDNPQKNYDDDGELISASHGDIKADDYFITNKNDSPIKIGREFFPKFEIENYTKKLNVRKVNDTDIRLLEFYISVCPDVEDRKTTQLINNIKKAINNPSGAIFLEIKEVSFITYKTVGVNDFHEYQYDIIELDKIIEFNGHYVIKYLAKVRVNGEYTLDKYRVSELDDKYDRKEKKKQ